MAKDLYLTKKIIKLVKPDGRLMNFGWGENTNIIVYKGFDNELEFIVRNHDRVPVNLTAYVIVAHIYDNITDELLFVKQAEPIDFTKGRFRIVLNAEDTFDISENMTLRMVVVARRRDDGREEILHTDYSTKNHVYLSVDAKSDPLPKMIQTVEEFRPILVENDLYYSSGILRGPAMKRFSSSLVTVALYFSSFTGRVKIEISLGPAEDEINNNWVEYEIQTGKTYKDYDNFSGIDAFNIEGNYNWLRILYKPDETLVEPGKITKLVIN